MEPRGLAQAALVLAVLAAAGGCGSDGVVPGGSDDVPPMGKIQEYVGDGHGETKQWPAFLPSPNLDRATRLPYRLGYGLAPKANRVRRHRVSWYELPPTPVGAQPVAPVITLQPIANEDSDLFVLEGRGGNYLDGAHTIGYSIRLPVAQPDHVSGGYAPDWVAFDAGPTGGAPTAQIAVYGVRGDPPLRHYRVEADSAWKLSVNGAAIRGPLERYSSDWSFFEATSGVQYAVHMKVHSGDPDIFIYQDESTEFVGSDTGTGDACVSFTAADTCRHYIRTYGYAAAGNEPETWVTSP